VAGISLIVGWVVIRPRLQKQRDSEASTRRSLSPWPELSRHGRTDPYTRRSNESRPSTPGDVSPKVPESSNPSASWSKVVPQPAPKPSTEKDKQKIARLADKPDIETGDVGYPPRYDEAAVQREFIEAASQLSDGELREFVNEHISTELAYIRALPQEQRSQAFRSLCAEWHPDKCPAIAGLATEIFQRLQAQKTRILQM